MKILKYIGLFILMLVALVINIIEGIIMAISYPIHGIDYVLHIVFKHVSEWTLSAVKKFNIVTVFKR